MAAGFVSIVGAGPGAADLITVRGLARIKSADVIVYDRLIEPSLLLEVKASAELVYVGKSRGYKALSQRGIESTLIDRARAGRNVVRLKGGDPFVFGRGGEEAMAMARAGIEYEVIPGVTSAIAAPAGSGIPVTHRGLASSVTIVTGHDASESSGVNWEWLGRGTDTIVVLMGLENLETICSRLIDAGRSPSTPAAILASATLSDERHVVANLAGLPRMAAATGIQSPATIVIGPVAAFPDLLEAAAFERCEPQHLPDRHTEHALIHVS